MPRITTYRFLQIRPPYALVIRIALLTAAVTLLFQAIHLLVIYRYLRLDLYACLVAVFFLTVGLLLNKVTKPTAGAATRIASQPPTPTPAIAPERLSAKEWQILKLVAAGMTNKEIAATQFVEISTVKTHLNNIYGKLSVNNRNEARMKYAEMAPSWPVIG